MSGEIYLSTRKIKTCTGERKTLFISFHSLSKNETEQLSGETQSEVSQKMVLLKT